MNKKNMNINYKIAEASPIIGCSHMTLIKLINLSNIQPLKEFSKGRIVKKLNMEMIKKLKNFKIVYDQNIKMKRYKINKQKNIQIDPIQIANNYKQTKYFDFFSKNF